MSFLRCSVLIVVSGLNMCSWPVLASPFGVSTPNTQNFTPHDHTELVNPLTGDFTYNLILLEVPSPELPFPINLAYSAGISVNQDASNFGLGWSNNPGSIARSTVGFPDDYRIEQDSQSDRYLTSHTETDDGFTVTTATSVRGLPIPLQGPASIGLSLRSSNQYVTGGGSYSTQDSQAWSAGATYAVNDSVTVGATIGITSEKTFFANAGASAFGVAKGGISYSLTNKGTSNFGGSVSSGLTSASPPTPQISNSDWAVADLGGYNINIFGIFGESRNTIRYTLNTSKDIKPFGALYLGDFDNQTISAMDVATDKNFHRDDLSIGITHIAYDTYRVNASGIEGHIRPFRFENGSLVAFGSFEDGVENDPSSIYHQPFSAQSLNPSQLKKYSSVEFHYQGANSSNVVMNSGELFISNDTDMTNRTSNPVPSITATSNDFFGLPTHDPSRGFFGNRFKTSRFVEWFTALEIGTNVGVVLNARLDTEFDASNTLDELAVDDHKIHAFKITAEDGMVYHFGLPVFARNETATFFPRTTSDGNFAKDLTDASSSVHSVRESSYAYSWLLTAITGPDFDDANGNGITDDGDYGMWIKFDYGIHENDFSWRSPYASDQYANDANFKNRYAASGEKQIYYISKISTRSHSAVFFYKEREDGIAPNGRRQLRTEEVRLFEKNALSQLELLGLTGSLGLRNELYGENDVYGSISIRNAARDHSLTTKVFEYDYSLRRNSPDAAVNSGKLTLKRIRTLGRFETESVPPFEFDYAEGDPASNPDYKAGAWDRWGSFKNDFDKEGSGDRYTTDESKHFVDAWSVRKITDPMGATLQVEYESDSYSRVGSNRFMQDLSIPGPFSFTDRPDESTAFEIPFGAAGCAFKTDRHDIYQEDLLSAIRYLHSKNEPLRVKVFDQRFACQKQEFNCCSEFIILDGNPITEVPYDISILEMDVDGIENRVRLDTASLPPLNYSYTAQQVGRQGIHVMEIAQLQRAFPEVIFGGGLRVSKLVFGDSDGVAKERHFDYELAGRSSGVTVVEPPAFDRSLPLSERMVSKLEPTDLSANAIDGVGPMVAYEVVRATDIGRDGSTASSHRYTFEVFDPEIHLRRDRISSGRVSSFDGADYSYRVRTHDKKSFVGRVKKIELFNSTNQLVETTDYIYKRDFDLLNDAGIIREITHTGKPEINSAYKYDEANSGSYVNSDHGWRLSVNEQIHYPSVLLEVNITKDGVSKSTIFENFDFFTGHPKSKIISTPSRDELEIVTEPAHKKYSELGSKVDDPKNKNMLTQVAAVYVQNVSTQESISGEVQTWGDQWNYRKLLNGQSGLAFEVVTPADDGSNYVPVWRPIEKFSFIGITDSSGSVGVNLLDSNSAEAFKWNQNYNGLDGRWTKTNEITLYNQNSHILETRDVNGMFHANKVLNDGSRILATASNSKFTEFAFSGAEDDDESGSLTNSEIHLISALRVKDAPVAHTGTYYFEIPGQSNGISYSGKVGDHFEIGKSYRASIWQRPIKGMQQGDGTPELRVSYVDSLPWTVLGSVDQNSPTDQFGDWVLLTVDFAVPAFANVGDGVIIMVHNDNDEAVVFDDFRVQPIDSTVNGFNYDHETLKITGTLDPFNIGATYEFDEMGRLKTVEHEFANDSAAGLGGFKKIKTFNYHHANPPQ